jgi:hypothetical protein
MPAAQRWLIGGGGVAALVAVLLVLRSRQQDERVAALGGEPFTQSQADSALQQLDAAGLNEGLFENGQIMVPLEERARYEMVLSQSRADSESWVNRWHEADSLLGQFADGRQQQAHRDEARARLISDLLAHLPDVEHAEIVWDEEVRVGWRRPPRVRATVYLQPKADREISFDTVDAVRRAVASSKAHLDAADVVVMDLQRMVAYSGSDDAGAESAHQRISRETAAIRSRVESALSNIDGVRVSVAIREQERVMPEQPLLNPAADAEETRSALFVSVPNAGLEVTRETFRSDSDAMQAAPRADHVNVVVRIPGEYVQQQLSTRIPPGVRLASDDSERLIADVHESIRQTVGRRVSDLIGSPGVEASVVVETEAVPFAAIVEPTARPTSWFIAAIAGPDARTWSIWAVVFGFGASLCWWLRDVLEWHGHRSGAGGEPAVASANSGAREATSDSPEANLSQPAGAVTNVTTMEGLLQHDAAAIRRFYAAHPVSDWSLALRGETEEVITRLLRALAAEEAAELRKAVRAHRPVRLREIEEAQQRILSNWCAAANRAA